jgi:arginyl-tRNA synthetase
VVCISFSGAPSHCARGILTLAGESQVTEEAMAKTAAILEEKKISHLDQGSVLIDFTQLVPGKEGKRLGKTVLR